MAPTGARVFNISDLESDMANNANPLKPGTPAPLSGQYQNTTTRTEVTATRGEPLPPTPRSGQGYRLVDPTKHKGGK